MGIQAPEKCPNKRGLQARIDAFRGKYNCNTRREQTRVARSPLDPSLNAV